MAATIKAYEAKVEKGIIHAPEELPDGSQVYIVVLHAQALFGSPEWGRALDEFAAYAHQNSPPEDIDRLDDDELNRILHAVRARMYATPSRD